MEAAPRIYITGASCAGVTTLGAALAALLSLRHVDMDDAYWIPTDPPYTTRRPARERLCLLAERLTGAGWVLSGSCDGWGDPVVDEADLIVFVTTPTPVRMRRLLRRERGRFGLRILPGGDMRAGHLAFRAWAAQYDRPDFVGSNRARHEAWLQHRRVPVLRLDGREPPQALTERAVAALRPAAALSR